MGVIFCCISHFVFCGGKFHFKNEYMFYNNYYLIDKKLHFNFYTKCHLLFRAVLPSKNFYNDESVLYLYYPI